MSHRIVFSSNCLVFNIGVSSFHIFMSHQSATQKKAIEMQR